MGKTSCKKGQYYCNTDKKCKPIPDGYKVREDGFLVSEGSNPRIPRKAGQPAKSKKHSDLYTDEDPKGTIHGLGLRMSQQRKRAWQKLGNQVDHMLIKFKQQLLWSKEQE